MTEQEMIEYYKAETLDLKMQETQLKKVKRQ